MAFRSLTPTDIEDLSKDSKVKVVKGPGGEERFLTFNFKIDPTITTENLAYYLVGEGVGLGVIDHGNIINGALGAATEIGHVSIDINGKPCDCGNVGCLERYCSTPAIHEMILKEGDRSTRSGHGP